MPMLLEIDGPIAAPISLNVQNLAIDTVDAAIKHATLVERVRLQAHMRDETIAFEEGDLDAEESIERIDTHLRALARSPLEFKVIAQKDNQPAMLSAESLAESATSWLIIAA